MMSYPIPTYEELKSIKEEYSHTLLYLLDGGYFRIKINEDGRKNIAIDYMDGGFLCYIHRGFKSKYSFSRLYRFNKKNYEGLKKLYLEMLYEYELDIHNAIEKVVGTVGL